MKSLAEHSEDVFPMRCIDRPRASARAARNPAPGVLDRQPSIGVAVRLFEAVFHVPDLTRRSGAAKRLMTGDSSDCRRSRTRRLNLGVVNCLVSQILWRYSRHSPLHIGGSACGSILRTRAPLNLSQTLRRRRAKGRGPGSPGKSARAGKGPDGMSRAMSPASWTEERGGAFERRLGLLGLQGVHPGAASGCCGWTS